MTFPQPGDRPAAGREDSAVSPADYSGDQAGSEAGVPRQDLVAAAAGTTIIRSEERLRIDTQTVEGGWVRVHKYIVTEDVSVTVQLSREEIRLEWVPAADGGDAFPAAREPVSPDMFEIILHAEQPVVTKKIVSAERVRLVTEVVTEDVVVQETLRQERIGDPESDIRGLSAS